MSIGNKTDAFILARTWAIGSVVCCDGPVSTNSSETRRRRHRHPIVGHATNGSESWFRQHRCHYRPHLHRRCSWNRHENVFSPWPPYRADNWKMIVSVRVVFFVCVENCMILKRRNSFSIRICKIQRAHCSVRWQWGGFLFCDDDDDDEDMVMMIILL